jgi:hypothetical protein
MRSPASPRDSRGETSAPLTDSGADPTAQEIEQTLAQSRASAEQWACPGYVDSRIKMPTSAVRPQAQNPLD